VGQDEEELNPPSSWFRHSAYFSVALVGTLLGFVEAASAAEGSLVLVPDLTMVVALLVFFVLLIFPVDRFLFQPIFQALDARRDRIAGTRARAEQLEADAAAALERYETAVQEVRAESEAARKEALGGAREASQSETDGARQEAEASLLRAREELLRDLETAGATLRQQAETVAREAATTVLGRPLT